MQRQTRTERAVRTPFPRSAFGAWARAEELHRLALAVDEVVAAYVALEMTEGEGPREWRALGSALRRLDRLIRARCGGPAGGMRAWAEDTNRLTSAQAG